MIHQVNMKITILLLALSFHYILINPTQAQSNLEYKIPNHILLNNYVEKEFDRISNNNPYGVRSFCGNEFMINDNEESKRPSCKDRILENRTDFINLIEYRLRLGIKNEDRIRITILIGLLLSYPHHEKTSLDSVLLDLLPFVNSLDPRKFHEHRFFNSLKRKRFEKVKGKDEDIIDKVLISTFTEEKRLIKELEDSKQMIIHNIVRNIYPRKNDEVFSYALNEHEHKGDKIINIDYLLLFKDETSNLRDRLIKAISESNHYRNNNTLLQKFDNFEKQRNENKVIKN